MVVDRHHVSRPARIRLPEGAPQAPATLLTPQAYYTGCELGVRGYTYQAVSTLFVGGAAAGVSALIVRLLDNPLS